MNKDPSVHQKSKTSLFLTFNLNFSQNDFMKYFLNIFLIYLISMTNHLIAFEKNDALILVQGSSTLSCGLKPIPPLGYKVGRCVNGRWEFVSQSPSSSTLSCGLKPIPPLGYKVGRCVNGRWEFVSK